MSDSINGLGIPLPPTAPAASPVEPGCGCGRRYAALRRLAGQVAAPGQRSRAIGAGGGGKGFAGDDMTQIEAMTAMKKADLALRLMIQIRNKIMDAYYRNQANADVERRETE